MGIEPATIDEAALAAARAERVDWRFKGLPATADGLSIAELAARRPDVFRDGFHPPLLVLEGAALEHNIAVLHGWAARHGLALAPHGKTTMAPELFARQLRAGAWAITAATIGQVRVYRAFGVSRIVLANELVDAAALRWVAAELAADPAFEFYCWADSVAGVELMTAALDSTGPRLPVLVELGAPGGRTGTRDAAAALAVAEAVAASPRLRLAGVTGYEGSLAHDATAASLSTVDAYLRRLRDLAVDCAGLVDGPVLVSAGGSAYFDRIAAALGSPWPAGVQALPVLRSGAYVTHDSGFYAGVSPLGGTPRTDAERLRPAMRVWTQVSSMPEPRLALLTAGKRDVSFDEGLPRPEVRRAGGRTVALHGAEVTALNDQHAYCSLPAGAGVRVGDWIGLGASHPCTVFDKWQLIPVVDADGATVTDIVRTYF